ncbi:MAG TPA: patatin-like phospholipase family protein [Verrucomicrobiae bacterium]|jgi:NTE family protein|nr:patatin-like phospholipase family protein [Verrucomicrobiae bacterium]
MEKVLGLAMTGGGARGAYQAGVLKRIGEIKLVRERGNPFPIVGGASAGAVNGAALAMGSDDFSQSTNVLANLWANLKPSDVYRCDFVSQAHNSLVWILDLSFGGALGGGNARSLLDATPLRHFLKKHLDCSRIQENIRRGHLYALAISATNYNSGKSYLFIQGQKGHPMWNRSRRVTLATKITVDHICASAAIPLVFQPVKLETAKGTAFFGDGCLRLQQPLSPIIRLGAEKIFAIGVRCESREHQADENDEKDPSLAQVMGVLFNVMFLDHLATDVEHLERLNQLMRSGHIKSSGLEGCEEMRPLTVLQVTPSVNLTEIAAQHQKDMPYLIQYFVNSLGRDAASCSDLMSYLLFTSKYTRALLDLGYHDANARIDEIEDYLFADNGKNGRSTMAPKNGRSREMDTRRNVTAIR